MAYPCPFRLLGLSHSEAVLLYHYANILLVRGTGRKATRPRPDFKFEALFPVPMDNVDYDEVNPSQPECRLSTVE
jgi:hypothetical protein